MKVPCENIIWDHLPIIRKELAISLMKNFFLNQKETATLLDLTPATICQYLSHKRGVANIADENILTEIDKSAKIIITKGSKVVVNEICRICQLMNPGVCPPYNENTDTF